MKKLLSVLILLPLTVVTATSQIPRLYTRPVPPSRDVLDRLKLTLAWHTRVFCDGPHDGLFSVQLLPGKGDYQLIVQTRKGMVVVLDGETGDLLWQTQVGLPYSSKQPVAFNSRALFVTRRDRLYGLDRRTGKHLYEGEDPKTKLQTVGVELDSVPSAAPVADELLFYVPMGTKVSVLDLGLDEKARRPEAIVEEKPGQPPSDGGARPAKREVRWLFDIPTEGPKIEQPLLLAGPTLAAVSPNGTFLAMHSTERAEPLVFKTERPVAAAMGQFEKIAYLASEDTNLYALNMESCEQVWRFTADAPIFRKPEVTTRDVYVSPLRVGLYRVDRETGAARWLNRQARQFLAVNREFVYATDPVGRLLILDYVRGTTMAAYDIRDFTVAYSNELTDRIYLGSEDGLLVCMHLRDQVTPLRNTLPLAKPKAKPKEEPKDDGDKKPDDKDKGDKKADDKGAGAGAAARPPRWQGPLPALRAEVSIIPATAYRPQKKELALGGALIEQF
jgi:outer membrane protein assembly factor BamB